MIHFAREGWGEFARDAEPVFEKHWQSLGLDREVVTIDIDHERYRKLEELGMLLVVTARADRTVIGYYVFFLHHHFHYKSAGVMGVADMYYLLPEYRRGGIGVRLLLEAERQLRALGVVRAHTSCKVHEDHEKLFTRLGWKFTDKTFSKLLVKAG